MKTWVFLVCILSTMLMAAEGEHWRIEGILYPTSMILIGEKEEGKEVNGTVPQSIASGGGDRQHITYGYDTPRGRYPYMAAIVVKYYYYYYVICGGVILNPYTVLTAAHCVDKIGYYYYYYLCVGVGITDLYLGLGNPGSQIIEVASVKIHENYGPSEPGYPNDLAILHLKCRIKYNDYVKPAVLATRFDGLFKGVYCQVIGWGYTEYGYPNKLQRAYQYGVSIYICRLFWAVVAGARILPSHLCTYNYPVSACFGDSGGPVICRNKVAGLFSWGRRDCSGCFPSVSTRISSYTRWIRDNSH